MALAFLLPTLSLVAMAIRISSPGPIIYNEVRHGHKGKKFRAYSFRTTKASGGDASDNYLYDSTRTSVGRFLGRVSLSDLPMFVNVLKGDMSLVGPAAPFEFDSANPEDRRRLSVRPGLIGLDQIGNTHWTPGNSIDFYLHYREHRSVLYNLKILFMTVLAVFRGRPPAK